jgi:hypothetical protein
LTLCSLAGVATSLLLKSVRCDRCGAQVEQDPMKLCFPTKESYQHIRAVALEPGGASVHTHRAIHWGSTGRQGEDVSKHLSCRKGNAPSCIQSGFQFFAVNLSAGFYAVYCVDCNLFASQVSPRISMSFSFADPEFEPPYITTPDVLPFPSLKLRVALLSAQLINYSSLGGTDYGGWVTPRPLID